MAGTAERIRQLKAERNAVILAHNYTSPEVQDIADLVGDSLGLSIAASRTDADVIVFCGVSFMGETAKILSPEKTVLLPVPDAICDMAAMCSAEDLMKAREEHPDSVVVGYVNTTAEAKSHMDICCTSGNALKVVSSLAEDDEVLFVPDRNLGSYISKRLPDRRMVLWNGCCPIHDRITADDVRRVTEEHPGAPSMAHPECRSEVLDMVGFVGSTEDMLRFCRTSDADEFVIITETGMRHRLESELPGKRFHFIESAVCEPMKRIGLDDIARCLDDMSGEVTLPADVITAAQNPVRRMTEMK